MACDRHASGVRPYRFAAILLTALMLAAPLASAQFLSPGEISKPHHEVSGNGDCDRCHTHGEGVPDRLCLECHRPIGARIQRGTGYHARSTKNEACAKCHPEHMGVGGQLIRWPGGSPEAFVHTNAGWALTGRHANAQCRDCHKAELHDDGNLPEASYLGLPTACQPCHKKDDPHRSQFGAKACDTCHTTAKWKPLTGFDHAKTKFPLKGKHGPVKCEKCHEKGAYAGVETTCLSCHKTPHWQASGPAPSGPVRGASGAHIDPAPTEFGDKCEHCHTENAWNDLKYATAEHKKFPLDGGHLKPKCTDCHGAKAAVPPAKDCYGCHHDDDAHKGQFGRKCEGCHQAAGWKLLRKGASVDHDKTDYPLRGEHTTVDCAKCHVRGRYKLPHAACLDCHKDEHNGAVGTKCEDCHRVDGFRPSVYAVVRHTTFALTGAHRAVACDACHRPAAPTAPDAKPPALDFRKGVTACATCHADPHKGQFNPRTCDKCHNTAAFKGEFKHDLWPLTGRHGKAACTACHADGKYVGTMRDCRTCHGDPHLGQFLAGTPVKDCPACHTTDGFKGRFDHKAVWPLEGLHATAACVACHKEVNVGDGRTTVRWRLGFQDCARCHQNAHEKAPGKNGAGGQL